MTSKQSLHVCPCWSTQRELWKVAWDKRTSTHEVLKQQTSPGQIEILGTSWSSFSFRRPKAPRHNFAITCHQCDISQGGRLSVRGVLLSETPKNKNLCLPSTRVREYILETCQPNLTEACYYMVLRYHKAQSISVPRHLAQHVHKSWIQYQGHWPWGLSVVPWDTWNWQKRRENKKNTPNKTRKQQPQLLQLSNENTQLHSGNGRFSQINRSFLTVPLHLRSQVTMNVSSATTTACAKTVVHSEHGVWTAI